MAANLEKLNLQWCRKLTKLPESSSRTVGYDDSGWTTYERCAAEQIKKFFMHQAKWKFVLDLGASGGEAEGVGWCSLA